MARGASLGPSATADGIVIVPLKTLGFALMVLVALTRPSPPGGFAEIRECAIFAGVLAQLQTSLTPKTKALHRWWITLYHQREMPCLTQ